MDCCEECSKDHSSDHTANINNQEEKKVSWLWIIMVSLIVGLLIFSILK